MKHSQVSRSNRPSFNDFGMNICLLGMSMTLVYVIISLVSISMANASEPISDASSVQVSHRYCNPKVSKPCGAGCVLLAKACHVPWTTSISGVKPKGAQASTTPKYVETVPQ